MTLKRLSPSRMTFGTIFLAILLVTAGCNGLGVGERDTGLDNPEVTSTPTGDGKAVTSTETATATATPESNLTPSPTPDPNALDLRELDAGVEQVNRSEAQAGEVDRTDPRDEQGYYEPVTFVGESGERYNITVRGTNLNQYLELHAPNGSVVAAGSDPVADVNTDTALRNVSLSQTGQYTVRVYSADESDQQFFTYTLSVNRIPSEKEVERAKEGVFAGDPAYWNETEQYTWWAHYYGESANVTNYAIDVEKPVAVNPEQDYAVITVIGGNFYDPKDRFKLSTGLGGAYLYMYDYFIAENNESTIYDENWFPETVYIRSITPVNRTLYQINAFTLDTVATRDGGKIWEQWLSTNLYGPANNDYVKGENNSTESLSDYPGINRTGEVQLAPNPWVENTTERINPTPPNETEPPE